MKVTKSNGDVIMITDAVEIPVEDSTIFYSEDFEIIVCNGIVYKYYITATRRGYISRKNPLGTFEKYDGKYGKGFIHCRPRYDTTQYVYISYYIEDKAD